MTKKHKILSAVFVIFLLGGVAFYLATAAISQQFYQTTTFAMDTFISIKFYGRHAEAAAGALIDRLNQYENHISLYKAQSDISLLEAGAGNGVPIPMSKETFNLLKKAKLYSEKANGLFDITIAPVALLWGITSENPHVPSNDEIGRALELVSIDDLALDESNMTAMLKRKGQAVDLGGIAKGAATDIVFDVMDQYRVKNGYVSLGGNMAVRGCYPDSGEDFLFGVRDPRGDGNEYLATLPLAGKTMATTGDYERYFEKDGVRYHHVLDPKTGFPAKNGLISVSVISEEGALADFLSTALFIGGKGSILQTMDDPRFSIIAVDEDFTVYVSSSLKGILKPNTEKAQYQFQYVP